MKLALVALAALDSPPLPASTVRWALPLAMLLICSAWWGREAGATTAQLCTLLVLAPVIEEAIFRAGVHELLLRRFGCSSGVAIVLTALAFGLAHVLVRGDASAFAVALPALAIGAIYDRRRQIRACAGAHAAMNALWLAWTAAGAAWPGAT